MDENIKLVNYEKDTPFGIRFVGETLCDEKYVIKRECSDIVAFEYIVEGTGTLEINDKIYHPKKGDMFFLSEKSNHKYYSQKENPWHKYFIGFYGNVADSLIDNYLVKDVYLYENVYLENTFKHIFDIAFNTVDINTATQKLTAELFNVFNTVYSNRLFSSEDLADKIKRYIDNNLALDLNLDNLSKNLNYSKNHIINVFVKKFNITPYKYYSGRKIALAKEYLSNSNMTIAEISNMLSYSDQQYFSYCFKNITGISPRKYRNLTGV